MMRVLDSSVVIAAVLNEPGGQGAMEKAEQRCISAVNLAEARTKLLDFGMTEDQIDTSIALLDTPVVAFSESDAKTAATLRPSTRKIGLSLGDRACIALAMSIGGKAITADRIWADIELPVEVELIR